MDLDIDLLKKMSKSSPIHSSFGMIFGELGTSDAQIIIEWIINANFGDPEERPDILNLLINSEGGSLYDAFAIIDVMKSSIIPIRTIGLGQISSAALMVFMSGTKGERVLTPNTSILSHRYSAGSHGKEHELFAIVKEFNIVKDRMMNLYKKATGLREEKIKKLLLPAEDVFLTAQEALELKLCDRIAYLK